MTEKAKSAASPAAGNLQQLHEDQKPAGKRPDQLKVTIWTKDQVGLWLHDLGIPGTAIDRLSESGLDGSLLLTWHNLLTEAPYVFYQSAHQELSLGLTDTLRLSKGLRSLADEFGKSVH